MTARGKTVFCLSILFSSFLPSFLSFFLSFLRSSVLILSIVLSFLCVYVYLSFCLWFLCEINAMNPKIPKQSAQPFLSARAMAQGP